MCERQRECVCGGGEGERRRGGRKGREAGGEGKEGNEEWKESLGMK